MINAKSVDRTNFLYVFQQAKRGDIITRLDGLPYLYIKVSECEYLVYSIFQGKIERTNVRYEIQTLAYELYDKGFMIA